MHKLLLRGSINTWRELLDASSQQRKKTAKILAKLRNIKVNAALQCWKQRVRSERTLKNAIRKIMLRWKIVAVSRAFEHWKEAAKNEGVERDLDARRERACLKFALSAQRRIVIDAYGTWQECVLARKKCLKVLARIMKAGLARRWSIWRENARDLARMRRVVVKHMLARTLRACKYLFHAWVSVLVKQRKVAAHIRAKMARTCKRAFDQWIQSARGERFNAKNDSHRQRLIQKILKRMRNLVLAKMWTAWVGFVEWRAQVKKCILCVCVCVVCVCVRMCMYQAPFSTMYVYVHAYMTMYVYVYA
jgi:hypothetical protein